MEQKTSLIAHNKQNHPPIHIGESNTSSIVLYTAEDNSIHLDVKLENETVWLSQQQMAMLFGTDRISILRHINNIYKSEELDEVATCAKIAQIRRRAREKYHMCKICTYG